MKLSKTQQHLLTEFKKTGSFLHYMPYLGIHRPNAYYFMGGTMERFRFTTVDKLFDLGFLERRDTDNFGDHTMHLKADKAKNEPRTQ